MKEIIQRRIFELQNKIAEYRERMELAKQELRDNVFEPISAQMQLNNIKNWERKAEFDEHTLAVNKRVLSKVYKVYVF